VEEKKQRLAREHTVLSVVVGAPASGLADPEINESMMDRRAVYAPPTELLWHFDKPASVVGGPEHDRISWEIETFCALALAADPAAYEVLASPLVEHVDPIGAELRELTVAFLSQRAADATRRATATDFARAAAAMSSGGTPRWGSVAGVIRALIWCEALLRTGELSTDVSAYRDELLAVHNGELAWSDTVSWVESLRDRTAEAVLRSALPPLPNTQAVQRWLVSVRRRRLSP
jgi:hypothetical protein